MKILLAIALLVAMISLGNSQRHGNRTHRERTPEEKVKFMNWVLKHKKTYKNEAEETEAMQKVLENKAKIDAHNECYKKGEVNFTRALWKHSDMSDEDKKNYLTGVKVPPNTRSEPTSANIPANPEGPSFVNWTAAGRVGPIEDQGWCGSCWAFSASGVIEGLLRKKNISTEASPQQMVDCSTRYCWGCNGGWPRYALDYVKANGVSSENYYPYVGYLRNCSYSPNTTIGVNIINSVHLNTLNGNETAMRDIVAANGPISVVIGIADSFWNYKSGIWYDATCPMTHDHAVLIVGYGTDPVQGDYWIVKNSWGTSWGENGYVRFARNRNNLCNIAYYAVYAT